MDYVLNNIKDHYTWFDQVISRIHILKGLKGSARTTKWKPLDQYWFAHSVYKGVFFSFFVSYLCAILAVTDTLSMTPILWIGLAFLIFFVTIMVVIMYWPPKNYDANIVRFFASLCAGFAGGFLSGQALFNMEGTVSSGLKYTISGSAGMALFFVIWFFWTKVDQKLKGQVISMHIPPGSFKFQETVNNIAITREALAQFVGFTPGQLSLTLNEGVIKEQDAAKAIKKVALLSDKLPEYTVSFSNNVYTLNATNS